MNWYIKAIKNYVTFSGRAKRREYWWFVLFSSLIASVFLMIDVNTSGTPYLYFIYILFTCLPSISLAVRRNHDAGYSGWWILCPVFNFILMFLKSDPEDNRFGPYPAETAK